MTIDERLKQFEKLAEDGMDSKNAALAMKLIGIDDYSADDLKSFRLWGDYMPMGDIDPYTEEQRNLHILWDSVDRVPLGLNCNFAVPFRQIIAKKLFKKCGDGFVANEGCRFNYGHRLEVGTQAAISTLRAASKWATLQCSRNTLKSSPTHTANTTICKESTTAWK